MPAKRGRPRGSKKAVEIEVLPPEEEFIEDDDSIDENDDPIVEQEHVIKNRYIKRMPLSEVNAADDDDEPEAEAKRIVKSERQLLKEKLARSNIGNDALVLRCDRMPNYQINGTTGLNAEKIFEFKMNCQIEFITGDEYLSEIQKRCGKGDYWLTLRHKNTILRNWTETVGGVQSTNQPQPVLVTDPNNPNAPPTVVYVAQQPNGAAPQQPIGIVDPMKQFRDSLKMVKEMKEAFGNDVATATTSQPAPVFDSNAINAEIMKTKAFAEGIAGIINPESGRSGKKNVTELLFEHGADILKGIGEHIVGPIISAMREGRQHGEAQVGQAQIPIEAGQPTGQGSVASLPDQADGQPNDTRDAPQAQTPEVQIMTYMIDAYLQKVPMRALIGNLRGMAELNPSLPDMLGGFAEETPENLLQFVGFIRPDLSEEVKKPEAVKWISELQAAINAEWPAHEEGE